jgi:hypothetical protein
MSFNIVLKEIKIASHITFLKYVNMTVKTFRKLLRSNLDTFLIIYKSYKKIIQAVHQIIQQS